MGTTVYNNKLNVYEQAKRLDPDNNVASIIELLNETNEFLVDAVSVPANDIRSNESFIRAELPTVGPRRINEGSSHTHSRVESNRDEIMLIEANPEIDQRLIDDMPDSKAALNNEIKPFIESMEQTFSENVFYGNPNNMGEIMGFSNKFGDLALDNVAGLGGSGADLTSIYMIEWDRSRARMIYPRNHKSLGVEYNDKGLGKCYDKNGKPFYGYSSQILMMFGLAISDPRNVQRICNIETTGATNNLIDTANLKHHDLVRARNRLPHAGKNAVIYCNRDIKAQFDIFALDKSNGFYTIKDITGEAVTSFQGMPIRLVDTIVSTEQAVA